MKIHSRLMDSFGGQDFSTSDTHRGEDERHQPLRKTNVQRRTQNLSTSPIYTASELQKSGSSIASSLSYNNFYSLDDPKLLALIFAGLVCSQHLSLHNPFNITII